jgi:hypothetical protein
LGLLGLTSFQKWHESALALPLTLLQLGNLLFRQWPNMAATSGSMKAANMQFEKLLFLQR